jgi:pycsar effector protein
MNKTDYNRFEISYLTDNIKFADSKAGVLIGMDGLLLRAAVDYFKSAGITIETLLVSSTSIGRLSVIFGSVFLISGIILSLAVVFPRRSSRTKQGFVFWESIAKYPSVDDYTNDVMNIAEDELDRSMAAQQYYVSMTATKKYRMLRRAFWASSFGALCIIITAFTLK